MKHNDPVSIQKQLSLTTSPLQKYRLATVGNRSFVRLALSETLLCSFGSIQGRAGELLRRLFYPLLFKKFCSSVVIGRDCSFRRTHCIELHCNVRLGEKVMLDVKSDSGGIYLGQNVQVGSSTIFSCPGGQIIINDGTRIGSCSRLGSLLGLTIGQNCVIGSRTYIVGAGHETGSTDSPIIEQPITCKGQNILGDDVTIGDEVTILDGIAIGSGAVIEDKSLVIRDVAPGRRVSGVPAADYSSVP